MNIAAVFRAESNVLTEEDALTPVRGRQTLSGYSLRNSSETE